MDKGEMALQPYENRVNITMNKSSNSSLDKDVSSLLQQLPASFTSTVMQIHVILRNAISESMIEYGSLTHLVLKICKKS